MKQWTEKELRESGYKIIAMMRESKITIRVTDKTNV